MRKRQRSRRGIIPQVTANENTLDALLKKSMIVIFSGRYVNCSLFQGMQMKIY